MHYVSLKMTTVKMDLLVATCRAKNQPDVSQKRNHAILVSSATRLKMLTKTNGGSGDENSNMHDKRTTAPNFMAEFGFRTLDREAFPAKYNVFKLSRSTAQLQAVNNQSQSQ